MGIHRFYCPTLAAGRSRLGPDESQHARRVLRLQAGETVELFDGAGRSARGELVEVTKSGATVATPVIDVAAPPAGPRLTLLTALPRQQRQPFLFEKATELGVGVIRPVRFERSTVIPKTGALERWRRCTIEAAKQSGCRFLPRIESPIAFAEGLTMGTTGCLCLAADVGANHRPLNAVIAEAGVAQEVAIWIGPEGGLSDDERSALAEAGVQRVTLGPHVLRIETAGIAAAALCAARQVVQRRPGDS